MPADQSMNDPSSAAVVLHSDLGYLPPLPVGVAVPVLLENMTVLSASKKSVGTELIKEGSIFCNVAIFCCFAISRCLNFVFSLPAGAVFAISLTRTFLHTRVLRELGLLPLKACEGPSSIPVSFVSWDSCL
jgi:hypothetical protein